MNFATSSENSGGSSGQLFETLGQAVRPAHVPSLERPEELQFVVARNADGGSLGDHAHDQAEDGRGGWSPVDQVPEEQRPTALRVASDRHRPRLRSRGGRVVRSAREAAVDVTDDVEGTVVGPPVVPQGSRPNETASISSRRPSAGRPGGSLLAAAPRERRSCDSDCGARENRILVPAGRISCRAFLLGHIQRPRPPTSRGGLRRVDRALASLGLDIRGVDDVRRPPSRRLPAMKCSTSKAALVTDLVVLIVAYQSSAEVEEITSVGRNGGRRRSTFPNRTRRSVTPGTIRGS